MVLFADGELLWERSGPRAGQVLSVLGCFYRLYFQYRGPAGWLGLPDADARSIPDGRKQVFEGGSLIYQRALDRCFARREPNVGA